jgi:GNAT superfamily N-acetyltransferase
MRNDRGVLPRAALEIRPAHRYEYVAVEAFYSETQFEKSRPLENTEILSINSQPVGISRHFIDKNGHCVIQDIQVSPTWQGKGVGTRVVMSLLDKARRDGRGVRLQLFKKNRARELYVRLGFKQVDETEAHYCMEAFPR